MAVPIIPRIERGRLYFQIADVLFPAFAPAAGVRSAAEGFVQGRCAMNAMNDVAEARATALSLRASAKACTPEQGPLKFRLMRAAESLDAMVLLAVRGFDRIEQLEQQLAAIAGASGEPAQRASLASHSGGESVIPADTPIGPVIVGGVDVAPFAFAARILRMVADEMDEGAQEFRA